MLTKVSSGRRATKNAVSGGKIDDKITEFIAVFKNLRDRFTERGVLAIELKLTILGDIRASS